MKKKDKVFANPKCFNAIAAGNRKVFERFCEQSFELLLSAASRFARSEEMGQLVLETFYNQLWEERKRLEGMKNLQTYSVKKIFRLAVKALAAARKLDAEIEERDAPGAKTRSEEAEELLELRIQLAGDKLTPKHRVVLRMCCQLAYTYEEVAALTEISAGMVERYFKQAARVILSLTDTPE
jgi:RNA polymerase sigma factor (sigma-70 family)